MLSNSLVKGNRSHSPDTSVFRDSVPVQIHSSTPDIFLKVTNRSLALSTRFIMFLVFTTVLEIYLAIRGSKVSSKFRSHCHVKLFRGKKSFSFQYNSPNSSHDSKVRCVGEPNVKITEAAERIAYQKYWGESCNINVSCGHLLGFLQRYSKFYFT